MLAVADKQKQRCKIKYTIDPEHFRHEKNVIICCAVIFTNNNNAIKTYDIFRHQQYNIHYLLAEEFKKK